MKTTRILIVEDNVLNMKLVRSLLHLGKFEVLEAKDAETGIRLAKQAPPDLILMDLQLPGMDGLEATQKIRKDPELNSIPVIALTSYAMQGDEEKAISAGCTGYIAKPIDTRSFLDMVGRFLDDNHCGNERS